MDAEDAGWDYLPVCFLFRVVFQGCFRRGAFSNNNERRRPIADEEKRFAARSEVGFS
jgi:hypothetical protein